MSEDYFGPALPPGYKPSGSRDVTNERKVSNKSSSISPDSSRKRKLSTDSTDSSNSSASEETDESPNETKVCKKRPGVEFEKTKLNTNSAITPRVFGPVLPGEIKEQIALSSEHAEEKTVEQAIIGPVLPPHLSNQAVSNGIEEDFFGPMPNENPTSTAATVAAEIEMRAKLMKDKLLGKSVEAMPAEARRDEWMTELPPELVKNFGVTARKFSTAVALSAADRDRSAWTETPADRARREQELCDGKVSRPTPTVVDPVQSVTDRLYAEQVDEYNKAIRPKSLLELHEEKHKSKKKKKKSKKDKNHKHTDKHTDKEKEKHKSKKKKKKESEAVPERRPFDRDLDLQASRLDDAQRKSIIQRSQQLTTRFGHGNTQFL